MKPRCPRCYTAKAIYRELRNAGNSRFAGAWQEIRHRHTKTDQCDHRNEHIGDFEHPSHVSRIPVTPEKVPEHSEGRKDG